MVVLKKGTRWSYRTKKKVKRKTTKIPTKWEKLCGTCAKSAMLNVGYCYNSKIMFVWKKPKSMVQIGTSHKVLYHK